MKEERAGGSFEDVDKIISSLLIAQLVLARTYLVVSYEHSDGLVNLTRELSALEILMYITRLAYIITMRYLGANDRDLGMSSMGNSRVSIGNIFDFRPCFIGRSMGSILQRVVSRNISCSSRALVCASDISNCNRSIVSSRSS